MAGHRPGPAVVAYEATGTHRLLLPFPVGGEPIELGVLLHAASSVPRRKAASVIEPIEHSLQRGVPESLSAWS